MKKLILFLLLAPLALQPVFSEADSPPDRPEGKQRFVEHMAKDLDLSSEQSKQVRDIMKEQQQKARALMEEQRKKLAPQMKAIHTETREKLAEILNEEQLKKFDEKMEHMREKRGKMRERFEKE